MKSVIIILSFQMPSEWRNKVALDLVVSTTEIWVERCQILHVLCSNTLVANLPVQFNSTVIQFIQMSRFLCLESPHHCDVSEHVCSMESKKQLCSQSCAQYGSDHTRYIIFLGS